MGEDHAYKYVKTCEICGKQFGAWNKRQKFCSDECRDKHKMQQSAMFREIYKEQKQQRKAEKKKKPSLADIAVAARQAGMTYGQYVAKMGI